jgi:very-short-patch-repair endonuclease
MPTGKGCIVLIIFSYFYIMRNHNIIPYTKDARKLASQLRKNMTPCEMSFWIATKSSQLGVVVRRQMPILDYVVDFYIKEIGLAIEIDGGIHNDNTLEDGMRQARIEKLGIQFIRFTNKQVADNLPDVLKELKQVIEEMK